MANAISERVFINFNIWSQSTPKYLLIILYVAEEEPIKFNL